MILRKVTFALYWFKISKGINFRENDQKNAKNAKINARESFFP